MSCHDDIEIPSWIKISEVDPSPELVGKENVVVSYQYNEDVVSTAVPPTASAPRSAWRADATPSSYNSLYPYFA